MLPRRERSGRSGLRRGSQKPGTTTARGVATPSPAAAAGCLPAAITATLTAAAAISRNVAALASETEPGDMISGACLLRAAYRGSRQKSRQVTFGSLI